jgi:hypothetical protein
MDELRRVRFELSSLLEQMDTALDRLNAQAEVEDFETRQAND